MRDKSSKRASSNDLDQTGRIKSEPSTLSMGTVRAEPSSLDRNEDIDDTQAV